MEDEHEKTDLSKIKIESLFGEAVILVHLASHIYVQ